MTNTVTRRPKHVAVAQQQLLLLLRNWYSMAMVFIPAVILIVLYRLVPPYQDIMPWITIPWTLGAFTALVAFGVVAAFLTWVGESPSRRRYHWSLPVRREVHDVLRVGAGAFWLLVGLGVFCVVAALKEPEILFEYWLSRAPLVWLSFFLVPLLTYLLCMISVLGMDRPVLWLSVIVVVFLSLSTATVRRYLPELHDLYTAIWEWPETYPPEPNVRFTLPRAISGAEAAAPWHDGQQRFQVYSETVDQWVAARAANMPPEIRKRFLASIMKPPSLQDFRDPAAYWWEALAIWYLLAILGITLAVLRRPDV